MAPEHPVWAPGKQGTLRGLLDAAGHAAPDTPFLEFRDARALSYDDFVTSTWSLAEGLRRKIGVARGDRVATLLTNGPAAVQTWFATTSFGGIHVPVNVAYRGDYLRHVLGDSGAEVVIVDADLAERVLDVAPEVPGLRCIAVVGGTPSDVRSSVELGSLDDAFVPGAAPPDEQIEPSDLACLIYTGGTTGPSKGCMISHNYLYRLGEYSLFGRQADEPAYTPLPLFHLNAMSTVLATLLLGSRAMVADRFSVSRFWPEVQRSGARFVHLLGPMASLLAKAPDDPHMSECRGQVRRVLSAPFDADTRAVFRDRFGVAEADAVGGYGLTEAAMVTALPPGVEQRGGASGMRTPLMDVRIVDDDDRELPPGEVGEIVCRPCEPHVMFEGYWNRPDDTLAVLSNLWFHTGDLGKFDEDGYFYFVDRKKDYLRRRGENISSMELEAVFAKHPAVLEVAAYGVPSEVGEDDVQISVVRADGAEASAEELCRWSIERVPYFAVPRFIEFVDELPKTPVGRVRKADLRSRRPGAYARWDRDAAGVELQRR